MAELLTLAVISIDHFRRDLNKETELIAVGSN